MKHDFRVSFPTSIYLGLAPVVDVTGLKCDPLLENWSAVHGTCYSKSLVRTFLVMMTLSMTSITVSNPPNPVNKTDVLRKMQVQSVVAAQFQE